jgi:hypothetical protein
MQLAPRSTQQPRYSLKRHDLDVAFALHIMGVYVRPFFLSSHAYDKANQQALSPRSTHKLAIRCPFISPSFLPSFLPSFTGI